VVKLGVFLTWPVLRTRTRRIGHPCHPELRNCFASRSNSVVEGSLASPMQFHTYFAIAHCATAHQDPKLPPNVYG
jgi:hypothetical protein